MPIKLGTVGHFGIAVRNPKKSARWWQKTLNLKERFSFPGGVIIGSDDIDIALHTGKPQPNVIDHVSFHLPSMNALKQALKELKRKGVDIEDPGHEIGSEGGGSKNMGLWFHDPDGYRWELSVIHKPARRKKRARRRR